MSPFIKSQPPSFTVDFEKGQTFTAGSVVKGSVTLDAANTKCEELTIKIRGRQHSTYFLSYGTGSDIRTQNTDFFGEERTVWRRSGEAPAAGSNVTDEKGLQVDSAGLLTFNFAFTIPRMDEQAYPYPPSFNAGGRITHRYDGTEIGKNYYFIKVTGTKPGMLKSNERIIIPFVYLPPDPNAALSVPPPIFPPGESTLPPSPPPAPSGSDWQSFEASQTIRSGVLGKKGWVDVTIFLPNMSQFPRGQPVPVYISIKVLSKDSPEKSKPSTPSLPSPSGVKFELKRHVWTEAQRASQETPPVRVPHDVYDVDKQRVWYGQPQAFSHEGEPKWGCEIVIVNEMTLKVAPSFPKGGPYHLACWYILSFGLPIPGLTNNLNVKLGQIDVSSGIKLGNDGHLIINDLDDIVPPSYFDATGEEDDDKKGSNNEKD